MAAYNWTFDMFCRLAPALTLVALAVAPAAAQHERGEIRLEVRDPHGGGLVASVDLVSEANQLHRSFMTGQDGGYAARGLPFGRYNLRVTHAGFLSSEQLVEVHSEVPLNISVILSLAPAQSTINVGDSGTLVDPGQPATIYSVGSQAIREGLPAQMGRSLSDLVNAEPGWLYEANGVLHPRGSEYDVQYVVDGVPLTQNRSPAFAPALNPDDVESMRVLTASYPAEYGRKLGGIVEVTTKKNVTTGFHVIAAAGGGSFSTEIGRASCRERV